MVGERHIVFACPYCGQKGDVIWSDDGADRVLLKLSDGFHVERGRLPGAKQIIICDACDEIDPPKVGPITK